MKKTTNGDQIILKILDDYVTTDSSDKIESYNYKLQTFENFETLKIDFSRLKSTPLKDINDEAIRPSPKSCSVINDITFLSNEKKAEILLHPVIQTYIDQSWNKMRKWIWFSFLIYFIYLVTFCFFLRNIFYRPLHEEAIFGDIFSQSQIPETTSNKMPDIQVRTGLAQSLRCQRIQEFCSQIACKKPNITRSPTNATFSSCGNDSKGNITCSLETLLAITITLLSVMYFVKLISLGPIKKWKDVRRVFNFENGVEFVVRVFGITSLVVQNNERHLQYCSAIGIMFTFLGK